MHSRTQSLVANVRMELALQTARVLIIDVLHHTAFLEFGQLQAPGQRE